MRGLCVLDPRQCLLIGLHLRLAGLDLQGGYDVQFKGNGPPYRYDDSSLDGVRLLSSGLSKCCQVLCRVKRSNGHRTS